MQLGSNSYPLLSCIVPGFKCISRLLKTAHQSLRQLFYVFRLHRKTKPNVGGGRRVRSRDAFLLRGSLRCSWDVNQPGAQPVTNCPSAAHQNSLQSRLRQRKTKSKDANIVTIKSKTQTSTCRQVTLENIQLRLATPNVLAGPRSWHLTLPFPRTHVPHPRFCLAHSPKLAVGKNTTPSAAAVSH